MADQPQSSQSLDWLQIGTLIATYGLPFAEKIITNWQNKTAVTIDEWNQLKALAQNTALSQMKAALARAGIPETDPHAQALLAQVPA